MVDKRVQENLHQSQMDEEAVNVEFLEWLQKWGPRIFIACCLVVIIFQGTQWWRRQAADRRSEAWAQLQNTQSVAGLLVVADDYENIGSIPELAWLRAASMHYQTLLDDQPIEEEGDALEGDALDEGDTGEDETAGDDSSDEDAGSDEASSDADSEGDADADSDSDPEGDAASDSDADAEGDGDASADSESDESSDAEDAEEEADEDDEPQPTGLSEADRADLLNKMEDLYQRVLDRVGEDPKREVFAIRATFGMALVAEMRQDFETAEQWYDEARALCGDRYDKLRRIAAVRPETMVEENQPIETLTQEEYDAIVAASRSDDGGAPDAGGGDNGAFGPLDAPVGPPADFVDDALEDEAPEGDGSTGDGDGEGDGAGDGAGEGDEDGADPVEENDSSPTDEPQEPADSPGEDGSGR